MLDYLVYTFIILEYTICTDTFLSFAASGSRLTRNIVILLIFSRCVPMSSLPIQIHTHTLRMTLAVLAFEIVNCGCWRRSPPPQKYVSDSALWYFQLHSAIQFNLYKSLAGFFITCLTFYFLHNYRTPNDRKLKHILRLNWLGCECERVSWWQLA